MKKLPITCPSGLSGIIRPIKVKEEKIYSDLEMLKSGNLVQEMCKLCWLETTDPGPYTFDGPVNWPKTLQGDAFWAFLQVRRASYGDLYTFSCNCTSCNKQFEHTTDLSKDMKMKELPEISLNALKAGQNLAVTAEDGTSVAFRLLLTEDEKEISNLQKSRDVLQKHASLMARIVEVDGAGNDSFAAIRYVEDMDSGEADYLLNEMEAYDCGVDTELTVTCKHCGAERKITLPLQSGFFHRQIKKLQSPLKQEKNG